MKFPHLHIRNSVLAHGSPIMRVHIPTGRVALEDVIRLAVEEFHVEPRRADWNEVLIRTRQGFVEQRTWA